MAAHISKRTVAEIIPAMPLVRVQVGVEVAIRRWPNPGIPMQIWRRRNAGRARPDAAIGPISPAMRLGDFPDHPAPNKFAQTAVAVHAMTLIAHLRGRFGFARHRPEQARFRDVVGQRLFAINGFAEIHRQHRGQGVMMIRGGNDDEVDLLPDFIVHHPVIRE